MKYNFFRKITAGIVLGGAFLSPIIASAEAPTSIPNNSGEICNQIVSLSEKKMAQVSKKEANF